MVSLSSKRRTFTALKIMLLISGFSRCRSSRSSLSKCGSLRPVALLDNASIRIRQDNLTEQSVLKTNTNLNNNHYENIMSFTSLLSLFKGIFEVNTFIHFNMIIIGNLSTGTKYPLISEDPMFSKLQFSIISSLLFLHDFDLGTNNHRSSSITVSCGLNTIIMGSYSSVNEADRFIKQIVTYYASKHKNICSPMFFIFLTVPNFGEDNEDEETPAKEKIEQFITDSRGTLETWANKFDIASQVFIVFVMSLNSTKSTVIPIIVEVYHIRNVTIVRNVEFCAYEVRPAPAPMPMKHTNNANESTESKSKQSLKFTFSEFIQQQIIRRSNFQQGEVIGINVDQADYSEMVKYKYDFTTSANIGKLVFDSGFGVSEYRFLRDALNFSETAAVWASYVKRGPNGTLTGLAIPLNNGAADISISASEFLQYRMEGPDGLTYLQPTFHNDITAFFKQPPAASMRDVYLQTLSDDLWYTILGTWALIFVSLLTVFAIKKRSMGNEFMQPRDRQVCRDAFLWVFSAICQQGWHTSPYSTSLRAVFLLGLFFGLLMYIVFSAALVAILSVPVVPIKLFQDLITNHFHILSDNHIPTASVVVKNLELTNVISTLANDERNIEISKKIQDLFNSKTAIVTMVDAFYPVLIKRGYSPRDICPNLSKVKFSNRPTVSSMVIKRGSPIREYLNYKVIMMKERGITYRLRNHYLLATSVTCVNTDVGNFQRLGLRDIFTAFILLMTGVSISVIIFGAEKLLNVNSE